MIIQNIERLNDLQEQIAEYDITILQSKSVSDFMYINVFSLFGRVVKHGTGHIYNRVNWFDHTCKEEKRNFNRIRNQFLRHKTEQK